MVSDVIAAVSTALYNEFGEKYRIYADNVEQGLTRPCFFINVVRPSTTERIMNRSYVSVPMVIQYFPSSQGKRTECYEVADRMFSCLNYPEFDGVTYRGTDRKYDINDDKLNFYVQYNFYTIPRDRPGEDTSFGEYQTEINTKREDEV